MYVFVDESGDAGFRFGEGSTRYLTFAAVVFDNRAAADAGERLMEQARIANGLSRHTPLHYYRDHPRTRTALVRAVSKADSKLMTLTLDKRPIAAQWTPPTGGGGPYMPLAEYAMSRFAPELRHAEVAVDGSSSRTHRRALTGRLRQAANRTTEGAVRRVRLYSAELVPLLQLADYCAAIGQRTMLGDPEARMLGSHLGPRWTHRWIVDSLE